jgi:hypothetical protein
VVEAKSPEFVAAVGRAGVGKDPRSLRQRRALLVSRFRYRTV